MNVANLICLRVSGRDSVELASQFDNTPPEPDIAMQPLYRPIRKDGQRDVFAEVKSPTGTGRQFVEVEQPRRLYSDVASERANQLSMLPNHVAQCRLLEHNQLVEYTVQLAAPDEHRAQPAIAQYIRHQSRQLGRPRKAVEAAIEKRLHTLPVSEQLPPPER